MIFLDEVFVFWVCKYGFDVVSDWEVTHDWNVMHIKWYKTQPRWQICLIKITGGLSHTY